MRSRSISALSGDLLPVESTLPAATCGRSRRRRSGPPASNVAIGGESFVTAYRPLRPLITPGRAAIALQRSLEAELAPPSSSSGSSSSCSSPPWGSPRSSPPCSRAT